MGHPVITRLGVNQFWYRHWYSDNQVPLNVNQDKIYETLLEFYLGYGVEFYQNPFLHEYWYRKSLKTVRIVNQAKHNIKFFRRFFYVNDSVDIEHTYLLRNSTAEYFPMRTWILKYSGWVVISVQWFKPHKGKQTKAQIGTVQHHTGAVTKFKKKNNYENRLRLVLAWVLSTSLKRKQYVF